MVRLGERMPQLQRQPTAAPLVLVLGAQLLQLVCALCVVGSQRLQCCLGLEVLGAQPRLAAGTAITSARATTREGVQPSRLGKATPLLLLPCQCQRGQLMPQALTLLPRPRQLLLLNCKSPRCRCSCGLGGARSANLHSSVPLGGAVGIAMRIHVWSLLPRRPTRSMRPGLPPAHLQREPSLRAERSVQPLLEVGCLPLVLHRRALCPA